MAVGGTTALINDWIADDAILPGDASGTGLTITKGDWVAFSGNYVIAANTGVAGWKTSGFGVALEQNPWYDELGVPRVNSALSVLVRGVCRVTAQSGASANLILGTPVFPSTTGSGIVGTTGATGINAIWATAAFVAASGATSVALGAAGGVARIVRLISIGSTGQVEIQLMPQRPDFA